VLVGAIDEIAADAKRLTGLDHVAGLDLLAYRHPTADTLELIRAVVQASSGPVIVAGSIASIERAVAVSDAGAWGYTIGSAIFDGLLPGAPSIADQVRRVLEET
jgi:putative N-acetylmannosamine-6-phosphate epimerase